jgi:hypothetical protein
MCYTDFYNFQFSPKRYDRSFDPSAILRKLKPIISASYTVNQLIILKINVLWNFWIRIILSPVILRV